MRFATVPYRNVRYGTVHVTYHTIRYGTVHIRYITVRQFCEFAGSSLTNIVHEQFANISPNYSPKPLFAQSIEYNSRTFRDLFAGTPFLPNMMNNVHEQLANCSPNCSPNDLFCLPGEHCSWTTRELFAKLFAQPPFLPNMANNVHEQFVNCSPNCSPKWQLPKIWRIVRELLYNCSRISLFEKNYIYIYIYIYI